MAKQEIQAWAQLRNVLLPNGRIYEECTRCWNVTGIICIKPGNKAAIYTKRTGKMPIDDTGYIGTRHGIALNFVEWELFVCRLINVNSLPGLPFNPRSTMLPRLYYCFLFYSFYLSAECPTHSFLVSFSPRPGTCSFSA